MIPRVCFCARACCRAAVFGPVVLSLSLAAAGLAGDLSTPAIAPGDLEADWRRQEELRARLPAGSPSGISPESDAAGGCDGVIDGRWGFHTLDEERPWWQVDLEKTLPLDRVVMYNRCDGGFSARAGRITLLLSQDGIRFEKVYQHDGTPFLGLTDGKPLVVPLGDSRARFVRLELPGKSYFHLDEVEIYSSEGGHNVALHRPASQSSVSPWSVAHRKPRVPWNTGQVIEQGHDLARDLRRRGAETIAEERVLDAVARRLERLPRKGSESLLRHDLDRRARRAVRRLALANPLLDFDEILFVKRAPGMFPHMSDQYYGWWSRGGGGIYLLSGFRSESSRVRCLTADWPEGSFLRPDLSHDGQRVLFAWCRHYPHVAAMKKVDKERLPEDAFYHIFEMNLDGSGVRQLTRGFYDDFDARYLPSGDIVFLSTRKGQALQVSRQSALATMERTCPDSYVRCGGDDHRPVAVFTLHAMDFHGQNLRPISAFENFEWTPSITDDGRVIYARWDYIDRFNGHFISLWSTNPDGTNAQLVYGNYTEKPQCIFEARSIPGSHRLVFTATAHHSITGGSLVLLDPSQGTEYDRPLTRLTPEVDYPEAEGWPQAYYAGPFPLSEEHYLISWSDRPLPAHRLMPPDDPKNPRNALGLYLVDVFGNLTLLHRDPELSSMNPIAVRPRPRPPVVPDTVDWDGPQEGRFLVQDVYQGLSGVERGSVSRLRIVGLTPKVQPHMNQPVLGVSREDPGKFVLGTVPVEPDGSAYFRCPSGISVFFQALDREGKALQTMRSVTYLQPGQTLACVGCHERRNTAPVTGRAPLAAARGPSSITRGPPGSWPLRFEDLVQPILDTRCVSCHRPDRVESPASEFDLTASRAYDNLLGYADGDLHKLVFEKDRSTVGDCPSRRSKLVSLLVEGKGHHGVSLDSGDRERLFTWMDTYAHRTGSFSETQAAALGDLHAALAPMLED